MSFNFSETTPKLEVVQSVSDWLQNKGIDIAEVNTEKPWGAYLVISPTSAAIFLQTFFADVPAATDAIEKSSFKILLVAPHQKLSWQYHFNRAELWKVIGDAVAINRSVDDELGIPKIFNEGDLIKIAAGERHRLIGLRNWGVVAEIWQHTNPNEKSNEDDIVRVSDDYNR